MVQYSPIKDMVFLLSHKATANISASANTRSVNNELPIIEAVNRLSAVTDMTRVLATLLWALLAIVKRRNEDLQRLDSVLTNFMEVWQERAASDTSILPTIIPVGARINVLHIRRAGKLMV